MACLDDATVLALVGGRLHTSDTVDEHLVECRACRDLVVTAARGSFASGTPPEPGREAAAPAAGIERYAIEGLVGTGGQALVYLARDTVLDRTIALKVLRDDRGAAILDEARLIARLAHRHIVAVHDAGATADGALYLAMEYASGGSLDAWLRTPRAPRDVLAACIEAGRGLAAAHAAGVVHRDVKAANILIGGDGHARVGDFGLATEHARDSRLAGTLAYMAPEQLDGHALPASDQFALAVTTWQALTGELPFATKGDRAAAILAGPSPPARAMPRHVAAALRRALDPDPDQRWPSMTAFVEALAADPARRRRRIALAGGFVALAGVAGVLAFSHGASRACTGVDAELADVWNADARSAIEASFARSHATFAAAALARTLAALDAYARDWTTARTRACEATAIEHAQSEDMLDRRAECLDERRAALGAAIDTLARADATVIEHADDLVGGLPALAACSNLAWLGERVRPPTDPVVRAQTAAVGALVAHSKAQLLAGKLREGAATAELAMRWSASVGHAPTAAGAALALGEARALLGEPAAAEASVTRATQLAQAGRDDRTAAEAWTYLVRVVGRDGGRYAEGLRAADFAAASIARIGNDRAMLAKLDFYRCALLEAAGRDADASAACERAHTAFEAEYGRDAREIADVSIMESRLAVRSGRFPDARARAERAQQIREHELGAAHPSLIETLFMIGQVASFDGRPADADAAFAKALAIARGAYGDDALPVAGILQEQAVLAHARGQLADALAAVERSNAIRARWQGAQHPDLVPGLLERARILDDLHRMDDALAAYTAALDAAVHSLGERHELVNAALQDRGRLLGKLGKRALARADLDRAVAAAEASQKPVVVAHASTALGEFLFDDDPRAALPLFERALASEEQLYGAEHAQLLDALVDLGLAEVATGKPQPARDHFERAVRIATAVGGEHSPPLLLPLEGLGDAQRALGDVAAARASWQRAIELPGADPGEVTVIRGKLAKLR